MQTHPDFGGLVPRIPNGFMNRLERRAKESKERGDGKITAGAPGEPVIAEWKSKGFAVIQRPADEQGILRISIGGGEGLPVKVDYLTFRGDHSACVDLLRRALKALENPEG